MKHFENILEIELSAKQFAQKIVNNLFEALRQFREFQNRVCYAKNFTFSFFVFFISFFLIVVILNQQCMTLIVQIVIQTFQNQFSSLYFAFVINFSFTSIVVSIIFIVCRFEKLSNIFKYECDKKHLNA